MPNQIIIQDIYGNECKIDQIYACCKYVSRKEGGIKIQYLIFLENIFKRLEHILYNLKKR